MTDKEFAEIINSSKGVVLSAIEKHLANRFYMTIDDVVQETYLRAYKTLASDKFRGESSIKTWLYTIARNESLRMNEKMVREEKKFSKSVEEYIPEIYMDTVDSDSDVKELYENIDKLPESYREVMRLTAEGLSDKEIALKLRIKPGTVKSRTSRGREMLKKIYGKGE